MAELSTKLLTVTIESYFKQPPLYQEAKCDEMARKALEAFASYGLKASDIFVKAGAAFNYEVSFNLFNGNGRFRISAEKAEVHFQGATGPKDFDLVLDCITKFYQHVPLPEMSTSAISANAHSVAITVEAAQEYLSRYADPAKGIVRGGTIAIIVVDKWKEEIKLSVEQSLILPAGLFITWNTSMSGGKFSREVLNTMTDACNDAAAKLDLTFIHAQ